MVRAAVCVWLLVAGCGASTTAARAPEADASAAVEPADGAAQEVTPVSRPAPDRPPALAPDGPAPIADARSPAPDLRAVDAAPALMPGKTPVFVAVGYAGRRIRSRDRGVTWEDDQILGGGGDDEFLLRAASWARGVFVVAGWKILTSPDGATWTEQKNPNRQWLGGIQYGNDRFVAAGGYGYSAYSLDGPTWMAGRSRATEAARTVAFGGGMFIAATDPGNWWSSSDGQTWTNTGGGHSSRVVYCGDAFKDATACALPIARNGGHTAAGGDVYVSVRGSTIERSTDGVTWKSVHTGGASFEAVAFGWLP
jgi:hypothetical protein